MNFNHWKASKIIWNGSNLESISWGMKVKNLLFSVYVGVCVGRHPSTNFRILWATFDGKKVINEKLSENALWIFLTIEIHNDIYNRNMPHQLWAYGEKSSNILIKMHGSISWDGLLDRESRWPMALCCQITNVTSALNWYINSRIWN